MTPSTLSRTYTAWPLFLSLLLLSACGGGGNTADATDKGAPDTTGNERYTTPNDAALVEWAKTAPDQEVADWFVGLRKDPLPADYVAPDWVGSATDKRSMMAAFDARYGDLRGRLGEDQRIASCRQDPLAVRQYIYDGKAMATAPQSQQSRPTNSNLGPDGVDKRRGDNSTRVTQ